MLDNLALGLQTALSFDNLLWCFVGVFAGTLLGVIPGIGVLAAISMLLPLTFQLDATAALIMLAGIWYGTSYGGSTASILLNVPGTPSSAITALDGYPMARQGRAGVALLMTTIASFTGGSIGILLLMGFSGSIAQVALQFSSAEYFALMLLGLVAASSMSSGAMSKGLIMVCLGMLFGLVGSDVYTGTRRFTFGMIELADGIALVALALGIFGLSEVIASIGKIDAKDIDSRSIGLRSMKPTREDMRRSWRPMLRGAAVGSFFGTLPGTGPSIAAFMSYAMERRISKTPEKFGTGEIEGITGPESANNAADQTAFIPTLALGIPGSATMALMLGALMIHGIAPGPQLMTEQPALFWGLVMSFWIGNLLLLVLNIPLIGLWVRLLTVPYHWLFPAVLMFICIGTYSVNSSGFDVLMVAMFGILGYALRLLNFPLAPMLLGFVLGPMMEEHFRRAMLLGRGDPTVFLSRPISAVVLLLTLGLLLLGLRSTLQARRRQPLEDGRASR
ncbi:MAG: tripartite tricarboxylate transporter permease [Paracoccus hibiscisoli]|uniref:tripartite tricarboxylate transporter permease n=1 Tax=Paracoccus hibiscisoli TaxID=2023261 RepID=UPI00391C1971